MKSPSCVPSQCYQVDTIHHCLTNQSSRACIYLPSSQPRSPPFRLTVFCLPCLFSLSCHNLGCISSSFSLIPLNTSIFLHKEWYVVLVLVYFYLAKIVHISFKNSLAHVGFTIQYLLVDLNCTNIVHTANKLQVKYVG